MTDRTDLLVILDRSGSMQSRQADHEGGLRSFIHDQRQLAGDVRLTFVRFDHVEPFEMVYDRTPLDQVEDAKLTLVPRGGTPLLEAVTRSLAHLDGRLAGEPPHAVIAMVITDGQENQSDKEYTKALVQARVKAWQDAGRILLYLGANVDEFAEGAALGVATASISGIGPGGRNVQVGYMNLSHNTRAYRQSVNSGGVLGVGNSAIAFTAEQRAAAKDVTATEDVNMNISKTGGA